MRSPQQETSNDRKAKHNFVIGCGKDCPNHKDWLSLDIKKSLRPDINASVDNINSELIKKHNEGVDKFQIIFFECISNSVNSERLQKAYQFLADDGALLIFPMGNQIWEIIDNEKFEGFIVINSTALIFKDANNLDNIVNTLRKDLPRDFSSNHEFFRVYEEIKRVSMTEAFKNLDPLLQCALAHIHVYHQGREDRFFKNPFKTSIYEAFQTDIVSALQDLNQNPNNLPPFLNLINKWKDKLPSSTKPIHKLGYTPLQEILLTVVYAAKLYADRSSHRSLDYRL